LREGRPHVLKHNAKQKRIESYREAGYEKFVVLSSANPAPNPAPVLEDDLEWSCNAHRCCEHPTFDFSCCRLQLLAETGLDRIGDRSLSLPVCQIKSPPACGQQSIKELRVFIFVRVKKTGDLGLAQPFPLPVAASPQRKEPVRPAPATPRKSSLDTANPQLKTIQCNCIRSSNCRYFKRM